MGHTLSQVSLHRVIFDGIKIVKANIDVLDDIFQYYLADEMKVDYGQPYIDNIKKWFLETKIPVVQAWGMNAAQVPQITIKLANESEAIDKAAIGDHWDDTEEGAVGVSAFNVQLVISIYASKTTDEVLWLYYILNYILFKRKRQAEALGLQLGTFSATDYDREPIQSSTENIYVVRSIRYNCTVQNFWTDEYPIQIDDIDVSTIVESASV